MFLQASVILLTGGEEYLTRYTPWTRYTPRCRACWEIRSTRGQYASYWNAILLPPANEVCEGYVFTGVCDSVNRGGACVVAHRGACVVAHGGACVVLFGGHAWFYLGGVCGFIWRGVHGFIWGGMRGFIWGGMHGFIWGVCGFMGGMHSGGQHAWFFQFLWIQ